MNALLFTVALALAPSQGVAAAAPAATVHIKNFAFVPATIAVPAGTTVRFVNDDAEAHTVTAVDKSFDSAGLDTGDAWTYRFTTPGKFAYFCALHPYMRGTVIIQRPGGTTT